RAEQRTAPGAIAKIELDIPQPPHRTCHPPAISSLAEQPQALLAGSPSALEIRSVEVCGGAVVKSRCHTLSVAGLLEELQRILMRCERGFCVAPLSTQHG